MNLFSKEWFGHRGEALLDNFIWWFFGGIFSFIAWMVYYFWDVLNTEMSFPLWNILVAFTIGVLIGFMYNLFQQGFIINRHKKITQDIFEGVLWEWDWEKDGKVDVLSIKPLCPQCKTGLRENWYHIQNKNILECRSDECEEKNVLEFEGRMQRKTYHIKEMIEGKVRRKEY